MPPSNPTIVVNGKRYILLPEVENADPSKSKHKRCVGCVAHNGHLDRDSKEAHALDELCDEFPANNGCNQPGGVWIEDTEQGRANYALTRLTGEHHS